MLMGDNLIQQQQEAHAQQKTDHRRKKGKTPHFAALVNGGNQQTPDRCCHHDPGGKAQKPLLHPGTNLPLQQKNTGSAQRGAQQGDQTAP